MLSIAKVKLPLKLSSLSYRFYAIAFCAIIISYTAITVSANIIIDPLWCFSHENKYNVKQLGLIEREQKTNYLTYRNVPYNALLIGNSRVMYMNQNDFSGLSVFNYAVSAMISSEYETYIGYTQKVTTNHIKTILLGLSFASVNDNIPKFVKLIPTDRAYYIEKATDPMNRLKTVLNPSVMKLAWQTFKFNIVNDTKVHLIFDRHNVARANELDKANNEKYFTKDLNDYRALNKSFHYDAGFKTDLRSVKNQNPGVRMVVFTTPVSKPLHCLISEAGLIPEYEQWIRDIIEVFGELYHFEYVHSIAENYKDNFIDANHYLPQIGTLMAHRLQGNETGVPSDFGIVITRKNIEQQLAFLRENFNSCRQ